MRVNEPPVDPLKPPLPAPETLGAIAGEPRSRLARAWDSDLAHAFRTSPVAIVSAVVALALIGAAVLAPLFAPQDPFNPAGLNLMDGLTKPGTPNEFTGKSFVFGTDPQGRDMFSAVLYGSRVSLLVGAASVAFSAVLGVVLGLMAGYLGGRVEALIMRIADIQLSFPAILIALLVFGVARGLIPPAQQEDATLILLILAIGLSNWAQYARTVRGSTLIEKNKEYVQAARVIRRPALVIMLRHILPNVMGPVTVIATINLALAIIEEATLSFLGVGMPPTQPSLGTLIRIGQQFLFSGEWWILFFPAMTLILLALAINLIGDWLRDALNPRLK
jgi:peptide/nickel transport system permease protein